MNVIYCRQFLPPIVKKTFDEIFKWCWERKKQARVREKEIQDGSINLLRSRMRTAFWPTLTSNVPTESCAIVYTVALPALVEHYVAVFTIETLLSSKCFSKRSAAFAQKFFWHLQLILFILYKWNVLHHYQQDMWFFTLIYKIKIN